MLFWHLNLGNIQIRQSELNILVYLYIYIYPFSLFSPHFSTRTQLAMFELPDSKPLHGSPRGGFGCMLIFTLAPWRQRVVSPARDLIVAWRKETLDTFAYVFMIIITTITIITITTITITTITLTIITTITITAYPLTTKNPRIRSWRCWCCCWSLVWSPAWPFSWPGAETPVVTEEGRWNPSTTETKPWWVKQQKWVV